jgi:hypothetical protein
VGSSDHNKIITVHQQSHRTVAQYDYPAYDIELGLRAIPEAWHLASMSRSLKADDDSGVAAGLASSATPKQLKGDKRQL